MQQSLKDEGIRTTLNTIPILYQTLHVVVILPGPICNCLRNAYDAYTKARSGSVHESSPTRGETLAVTSDKLHRTLMGADCLSATGAGLWLQKIWTFQEFRYSRSLSVLFADQNTAPCCPPYEIDPLTPPLKRLLGILAAIFRQGI